MFSKTLEEKVNKKKIIALVLLGFGMLLLAACSPSVEEVTPTPAASNTAAPAPTDEPTQAPEASEGPVKTAEPIYINIFCRCSTVVSKQDVVFLSLAWLTVEETQAADISEAAHVELVIDGQTVALQGNWEPSVVDSTSSDERFPFMRRWRQEFDMSDWDLGIHHVEVRFVFDKETSDGESTFSPGDSVPSYFDVEIIE